VALDRQSIEKKDFPVGRRGYEPEAVDAHLSAIAAEVDELKRSSGKSSASLATSAGEQVRAIVDAAETTAAQIRAEAEQEAEQTVTDARTEAERTVTDARKEAERTVNDAHKELEEAREQAATLAAAQIQKLSGATSGLLARIAAMEQEVSGLVENLRSGATRLGDELRSLEAGLGELEPSGEVVAAAQPKPAPAEAEAPVAPAEAESPVAPAGAESPVAPANEPELAAEPKVEAQPAAGTAGGDEDLEGARLIALNMALNGNSREDIDRYLAENFNLADRQALLDEVYASVEG